MQTYQFESIGVITSPFREREGMPIQAARSDAEGRVEVDAQYLEALQDIEGFSHIILVYVFHEADEPTATIKPFLDDQAHGVFATRYPSRPNPIGLSMVKLLRREGTTLFVSGVDVLDGTPLLDIKPYVPKFDVAAEPVRTGWIAGQEEKRRWKAKYE